MANNVAGYAVALKLTGLPEVVTGIKTLDKLLSTTSLAGRAAFKPFVDPRTTGAVANLGFIAAGAGVRIARTFKDVGESVRVAADQLARFAPGIGTIGAAGTIAGVAALTRGFGQFGIQTTKTAAGLGLSIRETQAYGRAFEQAGLSADEFAQSHANINKSLVEARAGLNVQPIAAARYAESLGFGKVDLSGNAEQVRKQVADVVRKMNLAGVNVETQKQFAASFGITNPDEISLLQRGGAAIQDFHDKADATVVVSDALVERGKRLGESLIHVGQSAETAGYKIAGDLQPKLQPLIDGFASLLDNIDKVPGGTTVAEAALGGLLALFTVEVALRMKTVMLALRGIGFAVRALAGLAAPAWLLRLLGPLGAGAAALYGGELNKGEQEEINAHPERYPRPTPVHRRHGDIFRFVPEPQPSPGAPGAPPGAGQGPRQRRPGDYGGAIPGGATLAQYDVARGSIAGIEHARYDQMGGAGNQYAGRYQLGPAQITETAARLGEQRPTQEQFLHDPALQERYFTNFTQNNDRYLTAHSARYRAMSPAERLGILAYAHNQGAGGAARYLDTGVAGSDAFGTSGAAYSGAVARNLAAAGLTDGGAPPVQLASVPAAAAQVAGDGGDTSHSVEVSFVNAPPGLRTGITRADGDARLSLRTAYALSAPF